MKKIFGISLVAIGLLLITLAVQSGYSNTALVDQDVGIEYTINDHQSIEISAITMPGNIQIARGVSVPVKYLINEAIVFDDEPDYECNIYYTISRIDYKPDEMHEYLRSIDKYPFAYDLGLRWVPSA